MRRIKLDCMRGVGSDYFGVRGRTRYGLPGFTQHQMYPQKQWDDKKPPKHRTSITQKINLTAISGWLKQASPHILGFMTSNAILNLMEVPDMSSAREVRKWEAAMSRDPNQDDRFIFAV